MNTGWDFLYHFDATFNFCKAEGGLITLGRKITGIARKQHQNREIFEIRETYDTFYERLFRASKYPHSVSAVKLQDKVVKFWLEEDERDAAAGLSATS